jgi:hypothetical protein
MAELFRKMEMAAETGRLEEAAAVLAQARLELTEVRAILNDALAG